MTVNCPYCNCLSLPSGPTAIFVFSSFIHLLTHTHTLCVSLTLVYTYAGCYASDGYTHDAECVIYSGPDAEFQGHEICFNYNEDTLTIVDVTHKDAPKLLSRYETMYDVEEVLF
jgi:hypothetical protein